MENISFLGTQWSVYQMFFYFAFYSFVGWCVEVIYMTLELGEFQNRGFLNGPICPIYGFGVVAVIMVLTPLQDTILPLYIGSVVLCTSVELLVGIGMEKLFHNTWWDYSHEKFNYKGYICLKVSLLWGLACLIMMRIAQPVIAKLIDMIPKLIGNILIWVIFAVIMADLAVSLCAVKNLNMRLKQLTELTEKLHSASIKFGSGISDEVLELKSKYDKLIEKKDFAQERILRAFPRMKSKLYNKALGFLKRRVFKSQYIEREIDLMDEKFDETKEEALSGRK